VTGQGAAQLQLRFQLLMAWIRLLKVINSTPYGQRAHGGGKAWWGGVGFF